MPGKKFDQIFMPAVALLPVLTFFIVMVLIAVAYTIFGEITLSTLNLLYILSIALAAAFYLIIYKKSLKGG
jgi:hypothetical protein